MEGKESLLSIWFGAIATNYPLSKIICSMYLFAEKE
jgi:hypothetical protein